MTVEPGLGTPDVALRQVGNGDPVIKWAPAARDLYGGSQGVYLDLPGEALAPGCVYSDDNSRLAPLDQAAVYAHVATQPDEPQYLAMQYWLFWYYNDWNDKHEGDWEFVQVLFRASSVEEALSSEPVSVGYAQHGGGETTEWDSSKLRKDGTHPLVFSSQNSHASYFEPALFLGRGASEGFGCDNTQAPSTSVHPRVVLLPDAPTGPDDPYAWLAFPGRWGERQESPNNGPTGPAMKPRWTAPVTWQQDLRPSSFVVPGGSAAAPPVISAFCSVVGYGSQVFISFRQSPGKVLALLGILLLLVVLLFRRTSWRVVATEPVVMRRRAGEIVRASWSLYRARAPAFAALGVIAVPVAVIGVMASAVLVHLPWVGDAVKVTTDDTGGRVLVASAVSAVLWPVTILLVSAAVARLLQSGGRPRDALVEERRRAGDLAWSFLPMAVAIVLLSLTVVGAPIAVWLAVKMQFIPQTVMLEDLGGWGAVRRSGRLVRGYWLHTAIFIALVWLVVGVTGIALGLVLLIAFTGLPLWTVSAVSLLCEIALVPFGAIALTLLYGDARAQRESR